MQLKVGRKNLFFFLKWKWKERGKMKFGENLKSLRKLKKISQEELAEKMGVTRQSVSKWECGESYPSMDNLLLLCNIFHCKMNDLVHESLVDLDSLGDEVKEHVAKLSQEKQTKMKHLSKLIFILARVLKIVSSFAAVLLCVFFLAIPFVSQNVKVSENEIFIFQERVEYKIRGDEILLSDSHGETILQDYNEVYPFKLVLKVLENHSMASLVIFTEIALFVLIFTLVFLYFTFAHLEKLFVNFYHEETPFTLENVSHIKKMAWYMIVTILVPSISGSFCEFVFDLNLNIGFELTDFIYILFLYSMSYIFLYGYEIQRDSKGRFYE